MFGFKCAEGGKKKKMAVPLLSKKIVKKRAKKFKRPQSDRKISVKVYIPKGVFSYFSFKNIDSVMKLL